MRRTDEGAGVISTFVGAAIFLFFLLFAAHLLMGLYAESVVSAVAYDAATSAAGADLVDDPGASARAVASARSQLGRLGNDATFQWSADDDAVRWTVRVPRPPLLPGLLPALRGPIEKTVRVRAERVR